MKRIPVTKLIRGQAVAIVYYDDYWDDVVRDDESEEPLPDLPNPLPEYTIEGDENLVREFEDFVFESEDRLFGEHFPRAWSKASALAYLFAKEKGIERERMLPKEYKELLNQPNRPGVHIY